jgi:hypothetical protein
MKSYHEMIQFIVDQVDNGKLRYYEWPAVIAIAEAYEIPQETVSTDILFEKEWRGKAKKERRKAESRASNEERRLANLAKLKHVSGIEE